MLKLWLRLHDQVQRLSVDTRGIAAVEFAMLVPLMLMIFFGTIQISTAVAVDRKVSLTARTLSDLISQAPATGAVNTDFTNAFGITMAILSPYSNTPLKAIISQVYIDPTTLAGNVVWSQASNATAHRYKDPVSVPAALLPPPGGTTGSYLILSEVTYNYQPIVGYDIKLGFASSTYPLGDSMFTRPRNDTCVRYGTWTTCPTTGSLP
jgi:Flp pilus assembly protein TadG